MSRPADPEKARIWRQRLQRYERGDLTIADFCSAERISEASFHYWRRRLADERPTSAAANSSAKQTHAGFMPVRVSLATVEIHLPSGARVSIPSGETSALRIAIEAASQCAPWREDAP